jgi:N-acetylglutamate synthase-like GNAT family acetyltransferase
VSDTEDRITAFDRALAERLSTRTLRTAFGTAFFHDEFPRRYDSNFVWVEAPLEGVSAQMLAAEADRAQAGLGHRKLTYLTDGSDARRLAPPLMSLGYRAERLLTMVQAREPDAWTDGPAEEVGPGDIGPFLVRVNREVGKGSADAEMLSAFRRVLAEHAGARFFVVREDSEIVAIAELYALRDVAQVEAVYTLRAHRERGYGRAVVLAASRAAREAGARLVFLEADDEDWPKALYGKLGFDELGRFWSFVKSPD